jgi:hypothetical protein
MQEFKDKEGKAWQITMNMGDVLRVKARTEGRINLFKSDMDVDGIPLIKAVDSDELLLYEIVYCLVEPQAQAANINGEAFAMRMEMENFVSARIAFQLAWSDFFRRLQRPDLAAALEMMAEVNAMALEKITAQLKTVNLAEVKAKVSQAMDAHLSKSAGSLVGKLDSTLATLLGGNSTS